MQQTQIKNELQKILSKIENQIIGAWGDTLEHTTEAVILEDSEKMKYNNWLKDLEILHDSIMPGDTIKGEKYARKCDKCGGGMNEGYHADGEYFCSDKCLHTQYTPAEWEELADMYEDTDFYWTDWEDTEDYQYQIINGVLKEIN